jgi:hypothetical protein
VVLQPPSEDRISIFVSLVGAKSAVLKMFSTGKVQRATAAPASRASPAPERTMHALRT